MRSRGVSRSVPVQSLSRSWSSTSNSTLKWRNSTNTSFSILNWVRKALIGWSSNHSLILFHKVQHHSWASKRTRRRRRDSGSTWRPCGSKCCKKKKKTKRWDKLKPNCQRTMLFQMPFSISSANSKQSSGSSLNCSTPLSILITRTDTSPAWTHWSIRMTRSLICSSNSLKRLLRPRHLSWNIEMIQICQDIFNI